MSKSTQPCKAQSTRTGAGSKVTPGAAGPVGHASEMALPELQQNDNGACAVQAVEQRPEDTRARFYFANTLR